MKFLIALFVAISSLVACAQASEHFSPEELDAHFEKFKIDHSRTYASPIEESTRKSIFASNLEFIYRHNAESNEQGHTYWVGVNQFADMTNEEFRARFVPATYSTGNRLVQHQSQPLKDLPVSVDWVKKGVVTPVKNQGQMGQDWAFAVVAAVESAHAISTGSLVVLSEAQLADCCNPYDAKVKDQSTLYDAIFQCVLNATGIDTTASYPTPTGQCHFNPTTRGSDLIGWVDLPLGSESALQTAVALAGPVAVLIDASQLSFQLYTGGIYNEPKCSSTVLDHAVTVVGYGHQNTEPWTSSADFWKVRNSWGSAWGEQGYIRMSRNKQNQCGIATAASYPLV